KKHSPRSLIEIAGVPRSGYYKWNHTWPLREAAKEKEQVLKEHMMAIHLSHPYYGCPRIKIALQEEGVYLNHKRVYRLMKNLGIQSVIRKKRRYFGQSGSVLFPNRLNQQFEAKGPSQVFVTDITYVSAGNRFYYLSVIQDLFNNEVVAWNLSGRNDLTLVMDTLSKLAIKKDVYGAVIHSDQGFQYTSSLSNTISESKNMA
ncbi:IS3 family transposase, partial [Domibacillus sp. 8LH]|uniref:IS3 family transposase n=1 Tax=Domibacillus sp. 8LH TaxID=3073900 RepID=UPI0031827E6B